MFVKTTRFDKRTGPDREGDDRSLGYRGSITDYPGVISSTRLLAVNGSRRHPRRRATRPAHVRDTYDASWDFPVWDHVDSDLEYMLAATPRSGSTYLALEMWRTGVMGAPMEYVNPDFRGRMQKRFGSEDLLACWSEVKRRRTSLNGVFGFKMFTMGYERAAHENPTFLARISPTKVVYLTRSDRVAQAVSYSKAIRSKAWFSGIHAKEHPDFDLAHIEQCFASLRYQTDFWQELFALTGTCVHHVTYESILENPHVAINGIAKFLGVQLDPRSVVDLPRMSIQRDTESADWINRLKTESRVVSPDLEKI